MSEGVIKSAVIDPTGMYRYSLSRKWSDGDMVAWVMLNPSTADASVDDPTIRRCISFSKSWGYGGLTVVNLYAYRATNPDALKTAIDPIGPEHGVHFMRALHASSLIVAAWGACRYAKTDHVSHWLAQRDIQCLGVTNDGSPRHPLYVKADVHLREWKLVRPVPHD